MALNAEVLNESLQLVLERRPDFAPLFYEKLFSRYPESRPLFSDTNFDEQQKMLQEAIISVVDNANDAGWLKDNLTAMGRRHVHYGVTEEMYPWVGECLLATLAEIAGDDWSDEIENAWKDAYNAIVGIMLTGAEEAEVAEAE